MSEFPMSKRDWCHKGYTAYLNRCRHFLSEYLQQISNSLKWILFSGLKLIKYCQNIHYIPILLLTTTTYDYW